MARILVIDDEVTSRIILRTILEDAGHHVIEAEDGKEGIRAYKEESIEIVITDILMPEKDGLEIISELCQGEIDVKIIAISSGGRFAPSNYLRSATLCGAICTFEKPVDRDELIGAIADLTIS